jgi:hypothetical protein
MAISVSRAMSERERGSVERQRRGFQPITPDTSVYIRYIYSSQQAAPHIYIATATAALRVDVSRLE